MITVEIVNIPIFLRDGSFYQVLDTEEEEQSTMLIPQLNCLRYAVHTNCWLIDWFCYFTKENKIRLTITRFEILDKFCWSSISMDQWNLVQSNKQASQSRQDTLLPLQAVHVVLANYNVITIYIIMHNSYPNDIHKSTIVVITKEKTAFQILFLQLLRNIHSNTAILYRYYHILQYIYILILPLYHP